MTVGLRRTSLTARVGWLPFVSLLFVLPACSRPTDASPALEVPKHFVAYSVVNEWSIPNGGYGRVISTNPALRSEAGLVALAGQLMCDTRADRHAEVWIYDDSRAAQLHNTESLIAEDMKLSDDHMIGNYSRNSISRYHAITILLQGANGPVKVIPLR